MPRRKTPVIERVMRRIEVDSETGCWLWLGATGDYGHGVIGAGSRDEGLKKAHRVTWEHFRGPIPEDRQVNHTCDVPRCVNPNHLYLGKQADNIRDMVERGRESRPSARLGANEVRAIRSLRAHGVSVAALSEAFGVGAQQVYRIASGKQWKNVG